MITVLLGAELLPAVGSMVPLPDDEAHHLRVRREGGEQGLLRWTNGAGAEGTARLVTGRSPMQLEIVSSDVVPLPARLMLCVAAGDRERWLWLAEKATELGATDLVPVETTFSKSVGTRLRESQLPRVAARAREACKQCGSAWAPRVHALTDLAALDALIGDEAVKLLADAEGGSAAEVGHGPVAVLIGPEGGFTAAEREGARSAGWRPTRLGAHILRFETAALAAAAVIVSQRQER